MEPAQSIISWETISNLIIIMNKVEIKSKHMCNYNSTKPSPNWGLIALYNVLESYIMQRHLGLNCRVIRESKGFREPQGLSSYGRIIYWKVNLCLFFLYFSFPISNTPLSLWYFFASVAYAEQRVKSYLMLVLPLDIYKS